MILKTPFCPVCKKPAIGTIEENGTALFDGYPDQGEVEYSGMVDKDYNDYGDRYTCDDGVYAVCSDGHDWKTEVSA